MQGWRSCAALSCSSVAVISWPQGDYINSSRNSSVSGSCCVVATNHQSPPTWLLLQSPPLPSLFKRIPWTSYNSLNKNANEGIVTALKSVILFNWRHNLLTAYNDILFSFYSPLDTLLQHGNYMCSTDSLIQLFWNTFIDADRFFQSWGFRKRAVHLLREDGSTFLISASFLIIDMLSINSRSVVQCPYPRPKNRNLATIGYLLGSCTE